jgi:dipeptidyl aminopeptidase/acylaminoacyl peptidase
LTSQHARAPVAAPGPLSIEDVIGIKWPSSHRWAPRAALPVLAFLWDDGGVVDLFTAEPEAGGPVRVSDGSGGITAFAWTPHGQALVYAQHGDVKVARREAGPGAWREELLVGGGNASEPCCSPDGTTLVVLFHGRLALIDLRRRSLRYVSSPGLSLDPDAWAPPAGGWHGVPLSWSPDGRHLLILFRDGDARQVGVITLDGEFVWRTHTASRLAYPTWLTPTRVVFADTDDAFRRRIWHLHDLQTRTTREIATESDDSHLTMAVPPVPAPDGSRMLIVLAPTGWDHLYVWPSDDAASPLRRLTDGPWEDVGHRGEQPCWSPDGRRVCFASSRRHNGERDLWVVGADGRGLRRLTDLPGNCVEPQWSPDGAWIAFVRSGPDASPDILFVPTPPENGTGEEEDDGASITTPARSRQVTWSMPAAWSSGVQAEPEEVTFASADGTEVGGYLYRPRSAMGPRPGPHPAVIWVHGGPQRLDVRRGWYPTSIAVFDAINQWLVQHGYVILAVNYRGSVGFGRAFERATHGSMLVTDAADVAHAARFLRQQPYVDPTRIGIWGMSYGGYLTLGTVAKYPDEFQVAINMAGIWDERRWVAWAEDRFDMARWHKAKLGGHEQDAPDLWFAGSPRNFVAQVRTPIVSFHGTADGNVNFEQLLTFIQDMVDHGKTFEAHVYPDEVHVFRWRKSWRDALPKILRTFDRYLRPDGPPAI